MTGCARCWPEAPDAAWEARKPLASFAELADESHFHVLLLGCKECGQRFVSVFTETVDWADGEDPQHWVLIPVTVEEASALSIAGAALESALCALPPERRCLHRDFAKGAEPRCFWGAGMSVGPHD